MAKDDLTKKQEDYCQARVEGMNQSDAYRAVYSTKNMSDKTIWEGASRLESNSKVAARIAFLKKEISDKLIEKQLWTRERATRGLVEIFEDREHPAASRIAAAKELNAMHGFDKPEIEEDSDTFVLKVEYPPGYNDN